MRRRDEAGEGGGTPARVVVGIIFKILRADIQKVCLLIRKLMRERHLDRDEWNFLLTAIFTPYGLGSLGFMMLVVQPASFRAILISLSVFWPLFFPLFLFKSFREFLVRDGKFKTFGVVSLMVVGFLGFAGAGFGYVGFINALTAPERVILAKGVIEKMEPRRREAPTVYLFDGKSTIDNIPISDEEYEELRPGDYYVSNMRVGGLGLYYRWRINSWNRGWEERAPRARGKVG